MKGSLDLGFGFQELKNTGGGPGFSLSGASHLIRSAEKLAASGRYDFAIEQLSVAQRLDPSNKYIQAIIDRIRVVQHSPKDSQVDAKAGKASALSVTVGPQFSNGVKGPEDEQVLSSDELNKKVRFLTNMADQFLEKGSSELAFDSLMKAYLLDPLSPYVIASEKSVLPAWQSSHTQLTKSDMQRSLDNLSNKGAMSMAPSNTSGFNSSLNPQVPQQGSLPQSADEHLRMEMLKEQKEQERLEKERAVWREASKPSKLFGGSEPGESASQQAATEQSKPRSGGLFSKLRLGKFLE